LLSDNQSLDRRLLPFSECRFHAQPLLAAQDRAAALIDLSRVPPEPMPPMRSIRAVPRRKASRCGWVKLEDVERSEAEHLDLRVFVGRRSASIGSSDLSDAALKELAARAVDMARAAPEDLYAGLAPDELLHRGPAASRFARQRLN
jgi:PmbA protein